MGVIEVSYTELSAEALRGVVEEFVTRAGTDYGAVERSLDQKIANARMCPTASGTVA